MHNQSRKMQLSTRYAGFSIAHHPNTKTYDAWWYGVASSISRFYAQVHHQNTLHYVQQTLRRIQNKPANSLAVVAQQRHV